MQIMEKGCFAGARFTRQKNIAASVLNKVVGELQFMVCGGHSFPGHARCYRFLLIGQTQSSGSRMGILHLNDESNILQKV